MADQTWCLNLQQGGHKTHTDTPCLQYAQQAQTVYLCSTKQIHLLFAVCQGYDFMDFTIRNLDHLKTVDTNGNCQRPVFSLGVSQHMHKITNLWKFELNWSSKLRDNNEEKKKNHPCHTKLGAFRCLISRPRNLILRS